MNRTDDTQSSPAPAPAATLRHDLIAGLTVALVAVPQCMGAAAIAGLPAPNGLYTVIVMGIVGAVLASSPTINFGTAITISTMVLAVLTSVAPNEPSRWPVIAGMLGVLVGLITLIATVLKVTQFVRFVSRSVLVGLTVCAGMLIIGSQLAPFLGLPSQHAATLIRTVSSSVELHEQVYWPAVYWAGGTMLFILIMHQWMPRWPWAFIAIVLGEVIHELLDWGGASIQLATVGTVPRGLPQHMLPVFSVPLTSELYVGAASMAAVGIIQTLAIGKTFAHRASGPLDPRRDLAAVGCGNVAAGLLHGFPGAGSFVRSALNDLAGARTRMSGAFTAAAVAAVVLLAAPLVERITTAAIAGLLCATAVSMVDWRDFLHILRQDRRDRLVIVTMLVAVLFVPIHWVVLVGLAMSVALFLRRVSRLSIFEMVDGGGGYFIERPIDDETGRSAITMLQLEGPLFFAHAEEIGEVLEHVFSRKPKVTIIRMRRTQQIDFSVLAAMAAAISAYLDGGGHVIICGLAPPMHRTLRDSRLGELLPSDAMLRTTREVFGSAHKATQLAQRIVGEPPPGRALFRQDEESVTGLSDTNISPSAIDS